MIRLKQWLALTLLINALLFSTGAFSHQNSTSYFTAEINSSGVLIGDLQIRLLDLERAIGLDQDGNGELTWGEALSQVEPVEKYLESSLSFYRDEQKCPSSFSAAWKLDEHFNEEYLVLPVSAQCAIEGNLTINYNGFFDIDSEHKLLLSFQSDEQSYSRVFSSSTRTLNLNAVDGNLWDTFIEFTKQGVIHIWIGLDHILFLMCLLLAAVFGFTKSNSAQPRSLRENAWEIVGVVTAFTLAHSITLAAVALNWIEVSSKWVEVGIAITVLAAALNNIFPVIKKIAAVTFGFGLLHGMGFAGVLGELGLPEGQKLLSVLAFNLGVELGQLAIILVVLPFMFLINRYNLKPKYWLVGGSFLIALIAIMWIVERV